jgi:hydrogenase nickel incorporation protein HypA/HybF
VHELSLCRSILQIADGAREGRAVDVVCLQVGQLRQVVPRTLEHCWTLVTEHTGLRGSRLEIEHVPVALRCGDCGCHTHAVHRLVLTCGGCGSRRVTVTHGEEFMLTTMVLRGDGDDG